MFGNAPFYHAISRKYVIAFGTLFNDITIERPFNNSLQVVKVPLTYAPQDKMLARVNSDPDLDRQAAAVSPAMSFEMSAPIYDAERKLQSSLKRCFTVDGKTAHQFVGVPYNFEFTLYIYAKEQEDGLRVLEQIIPYFTPSLSITLRLMPEFDYSVDVPVTLTSIDFDDQSYGQMTERRQLIWTLKFLMKGEFSGPVNTDQKGLIRTVHANIRDIKTLEIQEEVHIEPGLTVDGKPTSNSAQTIYKGDIDASDDYGFIIDINLGPSPH